MLHADELKCGSKRVFSTKCKCQTAFFRFIIFCGEYLTVVIESVEVSADVKNVSCNDRGLVIRNCRIYTLGEYRDGFSKFNLKLVKSSIGHFT